MTTVLYRGPFQGRRIRFLLDCLATARTPLDFVWLNPHHEPGRVREETEQLRDERPFLATARELDGSWRAALATTRALRRSVPPGSDILGIGFTALAYARPLRPRRLLWAVNGIPEERLLHDRSVRSRAVVSASWAAARIGRRPDLTVVVSEPMGRLVERRMPGARWAKAPTSVDRDVFFPRPSRTPSSMVYLGTGAPWQAIDLLAPIWTELHRRDPALRFLVVSRDERTKALLAGIAPERAAMTAAETPVEVAACLADAELAFLVRRPDIVNEASFPTKFGEYVASGVPVVATDVGWDLTGIIRRTGCGILVDPFDDPARIAEHVLTFRTEAREDPASMLTACTRAADELGRDRWVASLSADFEAVLGTAPATGVAR